MLSGSCFDTEHILADVTKVQHVASYVNSMADTYGVKLDSYNVAVENLGRVNNRGDFNAIYGVVREQSGLPFKAEKRE